MSKGWRRTAQTLLIAAIGAIVLGWYWWAALSMAAATFAALVWMMAVEVENSPGSSSLNAGNADPHEWKLPVLGDRWAKPARVTSFTDPDKQYTTGIGDMICTCPDFRKRRRGFDRTSPQRLCKHLAHVFRENMEAIAPDEITRKVVMAIAAKLRHDRYTMRTTPLGQVVFASTKKSSWVNVFADYESPERGIDDLPCFGYSLEDGRWAFGCEPANADELVGLIDTLGFTRKKATSARTRLSADPKPARRRARG